MNFEEIKELIDLVSKAKNIEKVQVNYGDHSITIERNTGSRKVTVNSTLDDKSAYAIGALEFKSPVVGTFYNRPAPNKKPFVSIGTAIKKGDPLCVIEAMKLYNTIQADFDGMILDVLVSDGSKIEYDQPLF